jgi:hypothetical protein
LVAAYRRLVVGVEAYLGAYRLEEAYRLVVLALVVAVRLEVSYLALEEQQTLLLLLVKHRRPVAMIATIVKFLIAAIRWFLLYADQEYLRLCE